MSGLSSKVRLPFSASKSNLYTNVLITSLYGVGLFSLYKDYNTTKKARKIDRLQLPESINQVVHDAPNRIWKPREGKKRPEPIRVLQSLTYGDVSQFAIGWGFLIQLSNMAHIGIGPRSLLYRISLLGVVGFPAILYSAFRLRLKEMEEVGVVIT